MFLTSSKYITNIRKNPQELFRTHSPINIILWKQKVLLFFDFKKVTKKLKNYIYEPD